MRDKALNLFEEHQKLVPYIFNKYVAYNKDMLRYKDDLLQEGYRALWQACISYSSEYGALSTYAFKCIKGRMYTYINDFINLHKSVLSTDQLHESLEDFESNSSNNSLNNLLSSTDCYFESDRVETIVQAYEEYWSSYKKHAGASKCRASDDNIDAIRIIVTMLDLGFNQTEIAKTLKSTKQTINNKIKTIQEALINGNYFK